MIGKAYESRGDEYRQRLREGFLREAKLLGDSVHIVDADRQVDAIQQQLREIARSAINLELKP